MQRLRSAVRLRTLLPALVLAVAAAGCAPAARPHATATPPPPPDPALQKAQAECAERATRETENVTPQSQASKAAIGIYFKCMEEKGFPPPAREAAPPGGAS